MISQSEIRYFHTKQPVREGRTLVVNKEDFQRVYIEENLTIKEAKAKYGISHNAYHNSAVYYKKEYSQKLRELQKARRSLSMLRNKRGQRPHPGVLLNKDELRNLVEQGHPIAEIARRLGTTEYYTLKNIAFYGVEVSPVMPRFMRSVYEQYFQDLEHFSPGLVELSKNVTENPKEFFEKLYETFIKLMDMVYMIKDMAGSHSNYRDRGLVEKNHICWSINRYEIEFSKLLLQKGIPHIRQACLYKNYMYDFLFPAHKLVVELDGDHHKNSSHFMSIDQKKEKKAKELGYRTLRISNEMITKNIDQALDILMSYLNAPS